MQDNIHTPDLYLDDEIDSPVAALRLIRDIGYDYDGYETAEDLKSLIDEIVEIAKTGIAKGVE